MENKTVTMNQYPLVEECYKYVAYDRLSFEECAEEFNATFPDAGVTADDIKKQFEQYINDGGKLPKSEVYLSLRGETE